MTPISFCEARTHLSELLGRFSRGKTIRITRRGKPAAVLSPPAAEAAKDVKQVITEMKLLRKGNMLGSNLSIRDLIEEGRRF
jgi:prevent-host-death family protein